MLLNRSTNISGRWWYLSDSLIRLWCTSPNAFFRSSNVTTRLLECRFESFIMCVSNSVCSVTPSSLDQKPFWISWSRYLFCVRYSYIRLFMMVANTLYHTGCNVMGLKFEGSSVGPFLYIRTVAPFFQQSGIRFWIQHSLMIRCSIERKNGHRFRIIIESPSKQHGEARDRHLSMMEATSLYVGRMSSYGTVG